MSFPTFWCGTSKRHSSLGWLVPLRLWREAFFGFPLLLHNTFFFFFNIRIVNLPGFTFSAAQATAITNSWLNSKQTCWAASTSVGSLASKFVSQTGNSVLPGVCVGKHSLMRAKDGVNSWSTNLNDISPIGKPKWLRSISVSSGVSS